MTTVGTGFTGITDQTVTAPATSWDFEEWGNWCVATNGKDAMQIWKGSGNFVALGGTPPTTAEIILKVKEYLLAINTDMGGTAYEWCDTDNVEDWVPVDSNRAGNNVIRDLDSDIIAGVRLGKAVAAYTLNQMAIISYISEPRIFGHDKALEGIGAVSKYSVVSVGDLNYGLCFDGFFMTDGQTFEWIAEDEILETFMAEVNWNHSTKINAFHDARHSEIRWYYPTGTADEPDKGIVYNYKSKNWSFLDHGRTASSAKKIFSYPFSADTDGEIYYENFGNNADSAAMTAYIETKPSPMFTQSDSDMPAKSLEDVWKYVDAVKLALKRQSGRGLVVKVGVQEELDDDILWSERYYAGMDMNTVYPEVTGRWITLRFESDQLDDDWELQGYSIHGTIVGGPEG